MTPVRSIVALAIMTAGCATWPVANDQMAQRIPAESNAYSPRPNDGAATGEATAKPPRLSVGVSYYDTQLFLPWFLTYFINAVNDP